MKFIHLSDTHFGAFSSYPKLHTKELEEFKKLLTEYIDFIVISGDIFNMPFQMFEGLDDLIFSMRAFTESGRHIYAVPGSHDISSGSSIFSILEAAGIITNVFKIKEKDGYIYLERTYDKRTGVSLYGIGGETNSREIELYNKIIVKPEEKSIFLFHSPIKGSLGIQGARELDLENMPKGFSYYAGGHVHKRMVKMIDGAYLIYPGLFFGSSFDELYSHTERGYVLVEDFKPKFIEIEPLNICRYNVNCENRSSRNVLDEIQSKLEEINADIMFINLFGKASFDPDEINIGKIPLKLKRKFILMIRKKDIKYESEEIPLEIDNLENEVKSIKNPFSLDLLEFVDKLKIEKVEGEMNDEFKKRMLKSLRNELERVEYNDNQVN
ncbi:MAG: metallophosphoesterase family protein [Thermoplasmata archaeon]